jgi:hypothetical protein
VAKIRGALVFLPDGKHYEDDAIVLSGGQAVGITASDLRGKKVPVAKFVEAIKQLRPVEDLNPSAPLEPPVIERGMIKRSKKVLRAIETTSTPRAAAKKVGMDQRKFKSWRAIAKGLKRLGPIKTKSCKGWIRPWDVGL